MRFPFNGPFPLTQKFGENPQNYSQFGLKGHDGLDYGLPTGTPVVAPHKGQVIEASFDEKGYGNYVKIENETEGSVLAHLEKITVSVGFQVEEGDSIGYSDTTGNATGPHLHWGYYTLPRDRSNGYDGFIDQLPLLATIIDTYIYKYKIGDVLEPSIDLMTYPKPQKGQAAYGHIGFKYQATVIGMNMGWYNVDQSAIGGGTGWTPAKDVDSTPAFIPSAPPSVPVLSGKPYSEEEYNALNAELSSMRQERDTAIDTYNELNKISIGFKAQGYETVDDVTKLLKTKDETISGVTTQLQQALKRSQDLADIIKTKDQEDSTAIDEGIKAAQEAKKLKDDLVKISNETGTKPNPLDILNFIWNLRTKAKKTLEQAKVEVQRANQKDKTVQSVEYGINWLMSFLGLEEGVNI